MFQTAPAGTPVERNQSIAAWEHREVFPRNSMVGKYNDLAGREAQFAFQISPGEWMVPSMSRIIMKLRLRRHAADTMQFATGGNAAYQNLRLACAPIAAMFSSMRFQSNGQTVEAVTNVHDLHLLRRRLTTQPGLKHGTLSCEHFDQRMHHRDQARAGSDAKEKSNGNILFTPDELKNDKQQLLMQAVPKQAEGAHNAGNGYAHAEIGNAAALAMKDVEVAGFIPLSCMGTDKAYPYGNYDLRATISSTCIQDGFYTDPAGIAAVASGSGAVTQDNTPAALKFTLAGSAAGVITNVTNGATLARVRPTVAELDVASSADDALELHVSEIKLLIVVARPQADKVPRPASWQCVYDRMQVFQRPLSATKSFVETISIPASTRLVFIDLASNQHSLNINRELSSLTRDVSSLSITYAGKVYPQPLYQLEMRDGQGFGAARAYADFLDVVGADVTNPVGAMSYVDYCKAPIFAFRILGEHLEASNSITLRLTTHGDQAATTDMRVFTASTVVWEQMGFTAAGATEQKIDEVVG